MYLEQLFRTHFYKFIFLILIGFFFNQNLCAHNSDNIQLIAQRNLRLQDNQFSFYNLETQSESREKLQSYLDKYILKEQLLQDTFYSRKTRFFLRTLTYTVSVTAGIPFVGAAKAAAGGNEFLEGIFEAGTLLSYAGSATWACRDLLQRFETTSPEENYFLFTPSWQHCVSNFLGAFSCLPDMYAIYQYNRYKLMIAPAFLVDYVFNTQGYYDFFELYERFWKSNPPQNPIYGQQDKQIIEQNILNRIRFDVSQGYKDVCSQTHKELEDLIENSNMYSSSDSVDHPLFKQIFQCLGLVFPTANSLIIGVLAYNEARLLFPYDGFCVPAAAFVTFPGFVLNSVICFMTMGEIYDGFSIVFGLNSKPSVPQFISLATAVPVICIILSSFSAAGDLYIAQDTLKNTSSMRDLAIWLPWFMYINSMIFESFTSILLLRYISREALMYRTQGAEYHQRAYLALRVEIFFRMIARANSR
ncbi:MAG: hypothetical protein C0425_10035 [Chlorobiaceae bacterium]|nr:hypothetical protein [Chlorobiaceae bacterium]